MKQDDVTPLSAEQLSDQEKEAARVNVKFGDMPESAAGNKIATLSSQAWEKERQEHQNKPWNSTPQGRAAIRLFSRGVLGASFFALGGRYAQEAMRGYHMDKAPENMGQRIAWTVDHLIGKPIEFVASHMGYDGKAAVTFRPTIRYGDHLGRSLGHEVMGMTFDFASMSIGDGLGRDIAKALDPHQKLTWLEDGHINFANAGKSAARSAWKYLTYNAGEDWAVSVPYVMFNRFSRNAIEKYSPGFGYDHDRRLNGGSFKVDNAGNVVGTYGLEGALDLQGRFTMYNIGTLMYREAYAGLGKELKHWYQDGLKLPKLSASPGDLAREAINGVRSLTYWAARDAIKGTLYMTPAVPFFWAFRTPQTKYRGIFIHPQEGVVSFQGNGHVDVLHANEIRRSTNLRKSPDQKPFTLETPTFFSRFEEGDWHRGNMVEHQLNSKGYDGYGAQHTIFDSALNIPGKVNNTFRRALHKPVSYLKEHYDINFDNKHVRMKSLTDAYANAAFAYTPYFFMKSDVMAYNWDTAKMDMGITDTVDGLAHLNLSKARKGAKEICQAMWHKPFDDPERELMAQIRMCNDESPPDGQYMIQNANCIAEAVDDITDNKQYRSNELSKRFVERLEEAQQRSNGDTIQFQHKIQQKYDADAAKLTRPDTSRFTERLQESRKRADNLFKDFRTDAQSHYADMVATKPNRNTEPRKGSFADQEELRKSDFPVIGTTIH